MEEKLTVELFFGSQGGGIGVGFIKDKENIN